MNKEAIGFSTLKTLIGALTALAEQNGLDDVVPELKENLKRVEKIEKDLHDDLENKVPMEK